MYAYGSIHWRQQRHIFPALSSPSLSSRSVPFTFIMVRIFPICLKQIRASMRRFYYCASTIPETGRCFQGIFGARGNPEAVCRAYTTFRMQGIGPLRHRCTLVYVIHTDNLLLQAAQQSQGIQTLLEAEKEAAKIVQQARQCELCASPEGEVN